MDLDNDSYQSESEFYYLDEENIFQETSIINTNISYKVISQRKKINTLFAARRSVLGKTVPSVLSTALPYSRRWAQFFPIRTFRPQITYMSSTRYITKSSTVTPDFCLSANVSLYLTSRQFLKEFVRWRLVV